MFFFAACATLDVSEEDLRLFKKRTRARAVCGYTSFVDWTEAAAFDLLQLESLASYTRIDHACMAVQRRFPDTAKHFCFNAVW